MREDIVIIGGGLAGSEAAWQAANRGAKVTLYEMRPKEQTAAHKTGYLAELVCSNSLGSGELQSAPGLLKEEMRRLGSLIIKVANDVRVPAGAALAVDRDLFAQKITQALEGHPNIRILREPVSEVPPDCLAIVATGPLTSDALAEHLKRLTNATHLYFYDSISPIVDADSIDMSKGFKASRYNLVGFQTKLTYGAQKRVFRMIPGLENAEFLRYGSVHRNTFVNAPTLLRDTLQLKSAGRIFLAGQLVGVEGYTEAAATGGLAGINAVRGLQGQKLVVPPETTSHGALLKYITTSDSRHFQPMNTNYRPFPPLPTRIRDKQERQRRVGQRALEDFAAWMQRSGLS